MSVKFCPLVSKYSALQFPFLLGGCSSRCHHLLSSDITVGIIFFDFPSSYKTVHSENTVSTPAWIIDYLTNRLLFLKLTGFGSQMLIPCSGVPLKFAQRGHPQKCTDHPDFVSWWGYNHLITVFVLREKVSLLTGRHMAVHLETVQTETDSMQFLVSTTRYGMSRCSFFSCLLQAAVPGMD